MAVLLALACNPSHAALALGSGGVASGAGLNHVLPVANLPPSLHHGVITALNLDRGEIAIHGNVLRAGRAVRIFSASGAPGSLTALHKGQEIRFLLDRTDPAARTISVIYLP
ncbi:hypothetical protein [Ralstonia soli]|uniref:Uncharacterized protein n=1 Tax=Ralstonia soli TaxID=2953896 RepID=A0ABT1AJ41_9RALS|nr:hypothetical protein [Ralstonia soli]MCO5398437.1 hypothetical protein [Ralstonia soli]